MRKPKVHIVYLCSPKVLAATRTWGAMNTHRLQVVISKYRIFIQNTRGSFENMAECIFGWQNLRCLWGNSLCQALFCLLHTCWAAPDKRPVLTQPQT